MILTFTVYDYSGTPNLNGYTLPITPLTFVPNALDSLISNIRIYWDFGDGSFAETLTASHVYTTPGSYNVKLYLYDNVGACFVDQYSTTVNITDYITDTFSLIPSQLTINAGHADFPFDIISFNSWQTYPVLSAIGYSFNLYASGGHVPIIDLDTYNKDKFAHLKPHLRFEVEMYNNISNTYDFVPVDSVTTTRTELYAAIIDGSLSIVPQGTNSSVFAGTSGYATVYFINDFPDTNPVTAEYKPCTIFVNQDLSKFLDADNNTLTSIVSSNIHNILNKIPQTFLYNTNALGGRYNLKFSSNGADGDGIETNVFYINSNKFQGTNIPFVVRIKDGNNYPVRYKPILTLIDLAITLTNNNIHITVCNDSGILPITIIPAMTPLSAEVYGGYFRGYINPQITANNVYLSATAMINSNIISTKSDTFNIYSSAGQYNIAKANENVDFKEMYKSYRFQEGLLDKAKFFDNYLGTIVGDITSDPNTLGKRVYEKTANFVDNTYNIDTCNVNSLKSHFDMVGANTTTFDQSNFAFPANIGRIVDLLSIKHSKLWGARNKFAENYDNKGHYASTIYGINKGNELDILTTTLTANINSSIIAYEKFSGIYSLCNTNLLSTAYIQFGHNNTYALSSYKNQWGWGLVLPNVYTGYTLHNYYKFYEYIPTVEGSLIEGVINWNDELTTLSETQSSYTDWVKRDGIMDVLISHSLYDGLELFTPIPTVAIPTLYWKNASGDGAWENPLNWFVDYDATILALNAPWVDTYDVNYLTYNLTTARGETSAPIMAVRKIVINFGTGATGTADFAGITNYGAIYGGVFSGFIFKNYGKIYGGKFIGNAVINKGDINGFGYIYGGLFTGDNMYNVAYIYNGYFTGNNLRNYAYVYDGIFSGNNIQNIAAIYGGTFTGNNNVNYGYIEPGVIF